MAEIGRVLPGNSSHAETALLFPSKTVYSAALVQWSDSIRSRGSTHGPYASDKTVPIAFGNLHFRLAELPDNLLRSVSLRLWYQNALLRLRPIARILIRAMNSWEEDRSVLYDTDTHKLFGSLFCRPPSLYVMLRIDHYWPPTRLSLQTGLVPKPSQP